MKERATNVVIDKRFCGPKGSANGGYAAGVFAQVIDGPAEATLKAPAPFDTPIEIAPDPEDEGRFIARAKGAAIASIAPGMVSLNPPPLPDEAGLERARDAYLADRAMTLIYPYCFVCGKHREAHEGLHIFAGPVPDSPVNADHWTPGAGLAGEDGLVRPEFVWAALDCPGAFALRMDEGAMVLLGRFTVDIKRRPAPGERLVVAAWKTGQERRKHFSSSAIYDEAGEIIAGANAVWIEIVDPALLARLKAENA